MCGALFWVAKKLWTLIGTILSLSDIGTDIAFIISLFSNCHYKYATASILILFKAFVICWLRGYKGQRDCCWFFHQLKLTWKAFWHGYDSLTENQIRFLGSIYVITCMLESLPEIGLAFYIMNHHGLDKPVFSNIDGDLQFLSLGLSLLFISDGVFQRHAWVKYKTGTGYPSRTEFWKAALWNFIPLYSFLVAQFIIMGHYELLFVYLFCLLGPQLALFLVLNQCCKLKGLDGYSMNRFLFVNTLIIAILHTIQLYVIGFEDNKNLHVRSFNSCLGTEPTTKLNYVFDNAYFFLFTIWSLVVVGLIHMITEAIFPPKNGFVNFWNFMFQKLHLNLSNSDMELQPI